MRSQPGLSFIALAIRQHERHMLTVTRRADSTLNRPALRPGSPPIGQELPVTAMVPMSGSPAADGPWEWLALPGGRIRPVVSALGNGGTAELLTHAA